MATTATDALDNCTKFAQFAAELPNDSPLYRRLAEGIAGQPDVANLLDAAPHPSQRLPVLLFAAVHNLVLDQPDLPLAKWYPTTAPAPRSVDADDPVPAFVAAVDAHRERVVSTIATRQIQTNEVGRCTVFLPAMVALAAEVGPLSLVDVGTSAGLNLYLDRYRYRFDPIGEVGPESPVHLHSVTHGNMPLPRPMPEIAGRRGVDLHPLDISSAEDRHWLKACIWPDQLERISRFDAAAAIAAADPPRLTTGDAVATISRLVVEAGADGHPVVMNSWALNYLTTAERSHFVAALDELGATTDLSWVYAESPRETAGLPYPTGTLERPEATYLMVATWRSGHRGLRHLAICHPHGRRINWLDS